MARIVLALNQGSALRVTGAATLRVIIGGVRVEGADVASGESVALLSAPWEPMAMVQCIESHDLRLSGRADDTADADARSRARDRIADAPAAGEFASYHRALICITGVPHMEMYLADFACGVDPGGVVHDWSTAVPGAFLAVHHSAADTGDGVVLVDRAPDDQSRLAAWQRRRSRSAASPAPPPCRAVSRPQVIPAAWESVAADVLASPLRPVSVAVTGPKGSGAARRGKKDRGSVWRNVWPMYFSFCFACRQVHTGSLPGKPPSDAP